MLISMMRNVMSGSLSLGEAIPQVLLVIIVVLFSLSFHEFAHGFVAWKMGDPTAKNMGRLTLDPRHHLDPIGAVCMLLFGFGWAKPVPVNSRYFRKPRKGMALTAVAGPVSNLIVSFVGLLICSIIASFFQGSIVAVIYAGGGSIGDRIIYFTWYLFYLFHNLNLYLAVFNLLPVPPLDGSRILFIFLPDKYYFGLMKYERYIMLALFALMWTGLLTTPLMWLCNLISGGMSFVIGLIPGL